MKVTKAKTAGFCFGVNRAVDMTEKLAREGKKVATMGPLIHNNQAIEALEKLILQLALALNGNPVKSSLLTLKLKLVK